MFNAWIELKFLRTSTFVNYVPDVITEYVYFKIKSITIVGPLLSTTLQPQLEYTRSALKIRRMLGHRLSVRSKLHVWNKWYVGLDNESSLQFYNPRSHTISAKKATAQKKIDKKTATITPPNHPFLFMANRRQNRVLSLSRYSIFHWHILWYYAVVPVTNALIM